MGLNLGSVTFDVGANASGLDPALAKIQSFGPAVSKAAQSSAQGAAVIAQALKRQEQAALSAMQATLNLNAALSRANAPPELAQRTTQAYNDLVNQLTKTNVSTLDVARSTAAFQSVLGSVRRDLADYKNRLSPDPPNKFALAMRDLGSATTLAVGPLSGVGSRVIALNDIFSRSNFLLAGFVAGTALMLVGTIAFIDHMIKLNEELESANAQLTALQGSQGAASATMAHLDEVAYRTGTDFITLAQNFGQFSAAAKGASLTSTDAAKIFDDLTRAGGGLHLSTADLGNIFQVFERIMSTDVVTMNEVRRQFETVLPGAFAIAAKAFGMTSSQFQLAMQHGSISAEDFATKVSAALSQAYGATAGEGTAAQTTRFRDALDQLFLELDKVTGASSTFTSAMSSAADAMHGVSEAAVTGSLDLDTWWKQLTVIGLGGPLGFLLLVKAQQALHASTKQLLTDNRAYIQSNSDLLSGFTGTAEATRNLIEQDTKRLVALEQVNSRTGKYSEAIRALKQDIQSLISIYGLQTQAEQAAAVANTAAKIQDSINAYDAEIQKNQMLVAAANQGTGALQAQQKVLENTSTAEKWISTLQKTGDWTKLTAQQQEVLNKALQSPQLDPAQLIALNLQLSSMNKSAEGAAAVNDVITKLGQGLQVLNAKDAAEGMAQVTEESKKWAAATQEAASSLVNPAFGNFQKRLDDIDLQVEESRQKFIGMRLSTEQVNAATEALRQSLTTGLSAALADEQKQIQQTISRLYALAQANQGLQAKGQVGILNVQNEDIDKLKAYATQIINAGEALGLSAAQAKIWQNAIDHPFDPNAIDALIQLNNHLVDTGNSASHALTDWLALDQGIANNHIDDANQSLDDFAQQVTRLEQQLLTIPKGKEAMDELNRSFQFQDTVKDLTNQIMVWGAQVGISADEANNMAIYLAALKQRWSELSPEIKDNMELFKQWNSIVDSASKTIALDFVTMVTTGHFQFSKLLLDFANMINEMIAEALKMQLIKPILESIFGTSSGGGFLGGFSQMLAGFLGFGGGGGGGGVGGAFMLPGGDTQFLPPGMAAGGPVMKGMPYLVGETGPELFMPTDNGMIMPNHMLSQDHTPFFLGPNMNGGNGQGTDDRIHLAISVQATPELDARIAKVSTKTAKTVVQTWSDKVLPSRVYLLTNDPQLR